MKANKLEVYSERVEAVGPGVLGLKDSKEVCRIVAV